MLNLDINNFERLSYVRKLGSNIQPLKHRCKIRLFNRILDAVKICCPINKSAGLNPMSEVGLAWGLTCKEQKILESTHIPWQAI